MEKYYLGIDGGGTKTTFLLCNKNGEEVRRCTLSGCNPIDIGIDRAKEILTEGISAVCDGIPYDHISVYAGIAGGISGDNQALLRTFLNTFGFSHVQNNSDAMNAVAASLQGQDGVAVIMGTGCVAFTKRGNEYIRTGGFGYLIDKGGDGYSIGRDALNYALYAEQRGEVPTKLLEHLQRKAGGVIMPLLGEIYAKGKAYIASFCPAVFEAMRSGDATAKRIIDDNVQCLSELLLEAAQKLGCKDTIPVRMIGSVAKQPEVVPLAKIYTAREPSLKLDIAYKDIEPVWGAVRLAMEEENDA